MSRRPIVETRHARGLTKAAEAARRAAVGERARACVDGLLADLEGQNGEFVFEVFRAVVRILAGRMAALGDPARSVGVLAGAQAQVCPAYVSATAQARVAANAIFTDEAA